MAGFELEGNDTDNMLQFSISDCVDLKKWACLLGMVAVDRNICRQQRRIFNILILAAQEQIANGDLFKIRLRHLTKAMEFNSNNIDSIKMCLREMELTSIILQSPTIAENESSSSIFMLSHLSLVNTNRGIVIYWKFPMEILVNVIPTTRYAMIPCATLSIFRSHKALALFEICIRYIQNVDGKSAKIPWKWLIPVLTGISISQCRKLVAINKWKYFHHNILKKAIAEINSVSEFHVEYHSTKIGDLVECVQFSIVRKHTSKFKNNMNGIDLLNLGKAIQLGITQAKAEILVKQFPQKDLECALKELEIRLSNLHLPKIVSPHGFLCYLISKNATSSKSKVLEKEKSTLNKSANRESLLGQYSAHLKEISQALFNEESKTVQDDIYNGFITFMKNDFSHNRIKLKNQNGELTAGAKSNFAIYLLKHFYGENCNSPSDSDLIDFLTKKYAIPRYLP